MALTAILGLVLAALLAGGCENRDPAAEPDSETTDQRIEELRERVDRAAADVRESIQERSNSNEKADTE